MVDSVDRETRSKIMGKVRNKDTGPEMTVRRLVHGAGYRYRLHGKKLPGKPDLVFKGRRKVIFVHGCFWHRHEGCPLARLPKSRLDFWLPKLEANRERDKRNEERLQEMGWAVLVIWECELKSPNSLLLKISEFLDEVKG
ncbi:very short patch repair endonuclease [Billgrantia ethanolica]|uniref:Very short patch repair endonuclease n=1 Tax=Billgrantia ethanolica TaxID=2733486 RepID=A0ABS9A9C6_9GAMM|nr:DNA mismatch endonuclease Vsr [Halomonas ethanolica]MCE8005286.1 DNA mismatch endonuclease Vsr [Halomonas ethanolica]